MALGVSEKPLLRRQNLSMAWNNEQKSLVRTEGEAEADQGRELGRRVCTAGTRHEQHGAMHRALECEPRGSSWHPG